MNARQERELLEEHLAFMDLRNLRPTQPRLAVTSGARVPELETALLPVAKRRWLHDLTAAMLAVRFTGTEIRQGRSVAQFSIQADTPSRPSVTLHLAYVGCLALDLQTGRLQSLTGKLVKLSPGRASSGSGPHFTMSIEAEYP